MTWMRLPRATVTIQASAILLKALASPAEPSKEACARDLWYTFRYPVPTKEGYPRTWVYSTILRSHQQLSRQERIDRAKQELDRFRAHLEAPRARRRSEAQIEKKNASILSRLPVSKYIRA